MTRRSCARRTPTRTRTSASARSDSARAARCAQFAQKLGFKKVFIVDDNETYGKGLADVFDAAFKRARRHGARARAHHREPARLQGAADQSARRLARRRLLRRNDVDRRRTAAPADGRRRDEQRRRSWAATASATTEFVKEAGPMAHNTLLQHRRARRRRSCRRRKAFVAAYKARFKSRRRPVQRHRLRGGADHHRGDRKSDQGRRRQDADPRAVVLKNIAATQRFPDADRQDRLRRATATRRAPILTLIAHLRRR